MTITEDRTHVRIQQHNIAVTTTNNYITMQGDGDGRTDVDRGTGTMQGDGMEQWIVVPFVVQ